MTTDPRRRERLAQASRDRSAQQAPRETGPAEPGDLFVLPAADGLPVEWALLEKEAIGRWLAVPADAGPRAGSADVEIPAGEPGGPLSLRCRFTVSLDGRLLTPDLRTGRLDPESVTEALHRIRQLEAGTLEPSPLAEEVDADPEYQDWVRDVLQPACQQASNAGRRRGTSGAGGWTWVHQLAAVLALVSVGLAFWGFRLQREVDRLSEPFFGELSGGLMLGEQVRGDEIVRVPRNATSVTLRLNIDFSYEPQDGYLEVAHASGESVWRSPRVKLSSGKEFILTLRHSDLPYGDYRVRIYPAAGFQAPPLAENTLRIALGE